jgi:hypothetical protein
MTRNPSTFYYLATCLYALILCSYAQASDTPDYVEIAKTRLLEMDETDVEKTWFYTTTAHTNEEILVSRNKPARDGVEGRELISVNGNPPSAKRLKKFMKQEAKRNEDSDGKRKRGEFSKMVDYTTLTLQEITNRQAILSFTPVLDRLEKDSDKLKGTIVLNTDTLLMEEFSVINTDKISPAFSVSFSTFRLKFLFTQVDGVTLYSQMETTIKGKAGFFKKFEESTEIVFSDYERFTEG